MQFLNRYVFCALLMIVSLSFATPSFAQDLKVADKGADCQALGTAIQKITQGDPKTSDEAFKFLNTIAQGVQDVKLSEPTLKELQSGYAKAIANLAQAIKVIGDKNPKAEPFKSEVFKPAFEAFTTEITPLSKQGRAACTAS
ncbi:hypothetical protein V2H45_23125 [Tumidithrix elongata RA019]|uniref:Uncharacterized protein n=1 Tax=Tumidithrix elongata BACA0141 TaxID=2716417 RepID=A0AAW9Q9G3_9CYAN|nr:hypothetical protein [Tumidithrix elongata RA019]